MDKVLIAPFDHSGNSSLPYKINGWIVIQIDIKHGNDFLLFDVAKVVEKYPHAVFGIIAPIPCTAYALSGNRHKGSEARKPIFEVSQCLVAKLKDTIDYLENLGLLKFWQLENPSSDIHSHNKWLGKPVQKFNPCDFAGYAPNPDIDRYNKKTWLWGKFNLMPLKRLEPIYKQNPGWKNLGGKSERTKELRSITPMGFAWAFYEANH